jgi:hypothetical protein
VSKIAVIWNENDPGMTLRYREIEKAAQILKVEVQAFGVREPKGRAPRNAKEHPLVKPQVLS